MNVSWPLIGRDRDLETIASTLDHPPGRKAGEQIAGGAVLIGRPGVGRTRLLTAAADRAHDAGHATAWVAASAATASVPFGAVAHLLPDEPPAGDFRLFRAAATGLARCASDAGRRLVLAVDDAHLLDDPSAAFIHYVAVHGHAAVVATVDESARPPDAVLALWKDGLLCRVEVEPLPDDLIDRLIDTALTGPVSGPARARLRADAAGCPLYLRELLLSAAESGALHQNDGVWVYDDWTTRPHRLLELVESRLRLAGPAARAAVELVACGEPLPLSMIESHEGLEPAERLGLVEVTVDGRRATVRLAHPVYGLALRTCLGSVRTREAYRTLAGLAAGLPHRRRDDALRLVTWQLAAGIPVEAPLLAAAATEATRRRDLGLAERLARQAADAGDPDALRLLADVLHWQGRSSEGAALLAGGPGAGLDEQQRTRWRVTQATTLYWGLASREEARAALGRPGPPTVTDQPATGGVEAMMALFDGDCHRALDAAEPVLRSPDVPTDSRLWAYTAACAALGVSGRTADAIKVADEGLRLAEEHAADEPLLSVPHLRIARVAAHHLAGRLTEAADQTAGGYRDALETGDACLVAQWASSRGMVARLRGDLTLAVTSLREAVALTRDHDPTRMLRVHLVVLAGTLAMTGERDEARQHLAQAEALTEPIPALFVPQTGLHRAWVAAAGHDRRLARDLAIEAAAAARTYGMPAVEAAALYDAVRHGAARRVYGRLAELAALVDGHLVSLYADSALAHATRCGPQLEKLAESFEELGSPLLAAETLAAAVRAFQSTGDLRRATRIRERARTLAASCPVARTGPLAMDGTADPLTPRERHVATLAATPMSSAEIAQQLQISVRTVDNHLTRVYTKLGVTSRGQLASLLRRPC